MMNNKATSLVNISEENLPDISVIENTVDDATALVVFAHGAGADKSSGFMQTMTELLNKHRINVLRFNFGYMDKRIKQGKRYPPDRMPKLLNCLKTVLTNVDTSLPIFLAGKSMGGRVSATLVENNIANVSGVICMGYPFHPQKKPEKLRLEPLQNTTSAILIVQGDRDALGNKQEIADYQISPLCQVIYLDDGDHDLKPRVKSGYTHQQHMQTTTQLIKKFIDEHR